MKAKSRIGNLSRIAALSFCCFVFGFYLIDKVVWGFVFLALGIGLAIVDIIPRKKGDNSSRTNR